MHSGRGREGELPPEVEKAKAEFTRAGLTHHLRCFEKQKSQNTRLGIYLKMPHTPAQLRRAAEHSASPPKNSAPCVTKIPSQRGGCTTAPPGESYCQEITRWPQNLGHASLKSTASIHEIPLQTETMSRVLYAHSRPVQPLRKTTVLSPTKIKGIAEPQDTRQISGRAPLLRVQTVLACDP